MQPINAWDATYYPATVTAATPSTTLVASIAALTALSIIPGSNAYYMATWPLVIPAFTASMTTSSYDPATNKNAVGAEPVTNFYKYPETSEICYMYEVMKAIQDVDGTGAPVTIYEYTQNTGTQTFTPTAIPSSAVSCQGYSASWVILDQRTYQS